MFVYFFPTAIPEQDRNKTISNLIKVSYNEYEKKYIKPNKLDAIGEFYGNALHDSFWAFALALNRTIPFNSTLKEVKQLIDRRELPIELSKNLHSFQGILGEVDFNSTTQELPTKVAIYQIVRGIAKLVGEYDPKVKNLVKHRDGIPQIYTPQNNFPTVYATISLGLIVTGMISFAVIMLFITAILVLILYFWSAPIIKASSPYLGIMIFMGCYAMCLAALMIALRYHLNAADTFSFEVLCNVEAWLLFAGVTLILATMLVRLARIKHIFYHRGAAKLSNFWKDYVLILEITGLTLGVILILLIWVTVDPFQASQQKTLIVPDIALPYVRVKLVCTAQYLTLWIVLLITYEAVLMIAVVILALKTRTVNIPLFKDTRSVSIFIYATVITFGIELPILLAFIIVNLTELAFIFQVFVSLSVPVLCQCTLFLPKLYTVMSSSKDDPVKSKSHSYIYGSSIK